MGEAAAARHELGSDRPVPFAAVVYSATKGDRGALARFVQSLKDSNVAVGGIIQEKTALDTGLWQIDAVDVATGSRILINRPTLPTFGKRLCSLDVSALAETTAILRTAIANRVALMVVEKFGDAERDGKGVIDEVFQAIAAGIPLLIAVPETHLDAWAVRSGGIGAVLPCEEDALREWWESVQREHAVTL